VAAGQDAGRISGYMFGDYYWVASDHDRSLEDANGFWFRRIYLTYDRELDPGTDVRLRLEMASEGDFSTKSKLVPAVKDAYVRRRLGRHQILFGISPTPTFQVIEKVWGYRSVEKTPLDLQKMAGSRDFGLALKGRLDAADRVRYHVMLANGNGNADETNKQKKVMAALAVWLTDALVVEGYADYDGRPDHESRWTWQGFAGWQGERARLGLQFAHRVQQQTAGPDLAWDLVSAFAAAAVADRVWLFGRADTVSDPNPEVVDNDYLPFAPDASSTLLLAGVDWAVSPQFHVMPNVEVVTYDAADGGADPDTDVLPRVTVFYRF